MSRAKPADERTFARYHNLVEGLCIASGLPKPRLYIIEDDAPNAFALSDDDVAIATGSAPADVLVRAAESCPSVAISVIDADSGEQIYP